MEFLLDEQEPQEKVIKTEETKLEPPKKELNIFIEQMKPLEERLGISIGNICTRLDSNDTLWVDFEFRVLDGGALRKTIRVTVLAYDKSGKIIATYSELFLKKKVFAFSSGSQFFYNINEKVNKLVVYPEDASS